MPLMPVNPYVVIGVSCSHHLAWGFLARTSRSSPTFPISRFSTCRMAHTHMNANAGSGSTHKCTTASQPQEDPRQTSNRMGTVGQFIFSKDYNSFYQEPSIRDFCGFNFKPNKTYIHLVNIVFTFPIY